MKKTRSLLSVLLVFVLAVSLCVSADAASPAEKGDVVVLYTNDVHCAADQNIGYAGVAALRDDMRALTGSVMLVDVGDALQGGTLGTLSKGEYPLEIMNQVGYDVAVPGNHEFDYGMDRFLELSKKLNCGYVCCNFVDLRTGKTVFEPYRMVSCGGVKVACVGIDTPEAVTKSTPAYFQDETGKLIYGFCGGSEFYSVIQKAIDSAKAAGADYVVAVGHCGVDEQSAPWRSTDIIAHVSGLSAFLDGHSHSVIPSLSVSDKEGKSVILTSSGTKLANVGRLILHGNGSVSADLVPSDSYQKKDAATAAFVSDILAKNNVLLNKNVASSSVSLTTADKDGNRIIRSEETNLGDFCADAYRALSGADVAIVNGGGIRANIDPGDITYGEIIAVHPFGNSLCVAEVTGQQILDALEMGARSCPGENGGFLQVSGMSYTIDTRIPSPVKLDENKMFVAVAGTRRVKDVQIGGKPLDPAGIYTLASHNYLLKNGGDGFTMFQNDKLLMDGILLDNEVLINYISKNLGGVIPNSYAQPKGRITILPSSGGFRESDWFTKEVIMLSPAFSGLSPALR